MDLRQLWKAGIALQRPDAGAALDAAAAAVPADTGAAAQTDSGGELWDDSDSFDNHAAAPDDNPLSSNIALSPCAPINCSVCRVRRRLAANACQRLLNLV